MKILWGKLLQFFLMTIIVQYGAYAMGFGQVGQIMITTYFTVLFFWMVGSFMVWNDEEEF